MPPSIRAALFLALVTVAAAPADAGDLRLDFHDGRVTISAVNVPVRQILAEWAKRGGTRIVNGERVAGGPVTLELAGVPERQALDVVLRNVAGYLVATRPAYQPGRSVYDRIMVLPTSSAPPRAALPAPQPPVAQPPMGQPPMPQPGPGSPEEPDVDDDQRDAQQPGMGPEDGEPTDGELGRPNMRPPGPAEPQPGQPPQQPTSPPILAAPGVIPVPAPAQGQPNNQQPPGPLTAPTPGPLPVPQPPPQ